MKRHEQDAVSGLLDGELTRRQRRRVLAHLRACPPCAAEYHQQRRVRRLLRRQPAAPAMPVNGEVFWGRVRAAIDRADAAPAAARPEPAPGLLDWWRGPRWLLAPVAATVAILVVALALVWHARGPEPDTVVSVPPPGPPAPRPVYAEVERAATVLPNTSVTAFDAEPSGVAVLWVDGLPWTPDLTEMKTLYASLDS